MTVNEAQPFVRPVPRAMRHMASGRGIATAMGQNALFAFPPKAFEEDVVARR